MPDSPAHQTRSHDERVSATNTGRVAATVVPAPPCFRPGSGSRPDSVDRRHNRFTGLPNEPEQKERAKPRGETDNWLSNPDRKSERKGDSQQSRSAFPELREREKRQDGDFHN